MWLPISASNLSTHEKHQALPSNYSLLLRMYNIPYPVDLVRGCKRVFIAKLNVMKSIVLQKIINPNIIQNAYLTIMFLLKNPFDFEPLTMKLASRKLLMDYLISDDISQGVFTLSNVQNTLPTTHEKRTFSTSRMTIT